ncbi:MAG: hypothetical protein ABUK01_00440 [Leptospirales bacterium]
MKSTEILNMQGALTLELFDRKNQPVQKTKQGNHIVLSGRDLVMKLFINEQIDPISHIAVGTGSGAVTGTDVKLEKEFFRKAFDTIDPSVHLSTTDDNRRKVILTTELDYAESNGPLTEAGIFTNAGANLGTMYNRVVFPPINKTLDFKLTLIWEILF